MNATLQQIGLMLDSVDVMRAELVQGTYNNSDRLREINRYVASMQSRNNQLEQELANDTNVLSIYTGLITKLQRDFTTKTLEVNTLTKQLDFQKRVNDTLRMIVESQAAEVNAGAAMLAATEQEVLRLNEEVKHLATEVTSPMTDSL